MYFPCGYVQPRGYVVQVAGKQTRVVIQRRSGRFVPQQRSYCHNGGTGLYGQGGTCVAKIVRGDIQAYCRYRLVETVSSEIAVAKRSASR
ncbi:Uncharacterised protein [Mycobacteroides abscessus subsp. abscessus]|nr:Uncharacterised protein [Mycobacteroides abscessus subsp. abscessus]